MRSYIWGALILLAEPAWAGSGPWVVGAGNLSVYTGVEAQRLTTLAVQDAEGERATQEVGEGLATFGVKAIASLGLTDRVELEATIPWYTVRTEREDAALCAALGVSRCDATSSVGVLQARAKGLLLDEYFGAPLSFALGGELRYGDFTAATRDRITNVGEGTLDVGPFVTLGRTGSVGKGAWSAQASGGWRYRTPNTQGFPGTDDDQRGVPGSEVTADAEVLAGPTTKFSLGVYAAFLHRLAGQDFGELNTAEVTDPDWLSALQITNARLGGVMILRGTEDLVFSGSVLTTVYARNNPTDTLTVSLGLSFTDRLGAKR